jgi:hypothetical protein
LLSLSQPFFSARIELKVKRAILVLLRLLVFQAAKEEICDEKTTDQHSRGTALVVFSAFMRSLEGMEREGKLVLIPSGGNVCNYDGFVPGILENFKTMKTEDFPVEFRERPTQRSYQIRNNGPPWSPR